MKKMTACVAIRAKCLDCSCYQTNEVRLCINKKCPLWGFRMGHRPKEYLDIEFNGPRFKMSESEAYYAENATEFTETDSDDE